MYYTIGLLFCEERNGIFEHIPFSSKVTTNEKEAQELFDYYLRAYTDNWRGNELLYDTPKKLDCFCTIRETMIKCNEPAYKHGYYSLDLMAYNHNPHE